MKVSGNGQGKILTSDELRRLFTDGLKSPRDRALFGICLFTGCRVSEALALQTTDIKSGTLTFRKSTTKGKLKTRVVDIQPVIASKRQLNDSLKGEFRVLECMTALYFCDSRRANT